MTVDFIELTMLFCSVTPNINLLRTFFLIQLDYPKKNLSIFCLVLLAFYKQNSKDLGCILSPCLFNLYAENIMRNARLEETQVGIKIAGRNINLRYIDDTTLMAESEEELKSLLMKVKEESEKVGVSSTFRK